MRESNDKDAAALPTNDVPFELRGFSLATVALGLGGLITVGSLAEVRHTLHIKGHGNRTGTFWPWCIHRVFGLFCMHSIHFSPLQHTHPYIQYLTTSGSEGLSGVGFVYGIPILLIGLSLQYAQLNPVPVEVSF